MKNNIKNVINPQVFIYQAKTGAIEFKGDLKTETIWASQAQIRDLFQVDQSVISRHIRNIFKDGEIEQTGNMQKMHIAFSDKPVVFYSLDVILSVGYRTNSKVAIAFRKWATEILRCYLLDDYVINKKRIVQNHSEFLKAVDGVKKLLPATSSFKAKDAIGLIELFANTWFSLDSYDKTEFPATGATKRKISVTSGQLNKALASLKATLIKKHEATELFAQEKHSGNLAGIIGNIFQSFAEQDVYPSIEEKAAHLLYFIIKNHPFTDGNKRSGAFAFVWFLKKAKLLDTNRLTPEALTTLTILIAESNPKDKARMIGLILLLLRKSDD
jgi:prophage maintenance system killer protein